MEPMGWKDEPLRADESWPMKCPSEVGQAWGERKPPSESGERWGYQLGFAVKWGLTWLWVCSESGHSFAYLAHIRFTEFSHCGRTELF